MLTYQQFLLICSLFLWDGVFGGGCFSTPRTSSSSSAPAQLMRGGGGSSRGEQMPSPQRERKKLKRAKSATPRTSVATVNPHSSLSRTHSEDPIEDFISYAKNTNEPGFKLGIRQPPVKPKPYRSEQIQELIENKRYLTSKSNIEDYVEKRQNTNSMALRQNFNDKMPNGRGGRMKEKMPMEMNSPRPRRRNSTGSHRAEQTKQMMDKMPKWTEAQVKTARDRKKDEMDKLWQELQDDEERSKRPPSLNEKQFDKLWEDFNEKDKEEALAVEMNAKIGKKHRKSAEKKRQNAEASRSSNEGKMGTKKVNGESAKKGKSGGGKKKQSHSS
ncbi:hypothetical protein niasHT_024899 [Heterodera trifolii]|uniref:Uncharacterized protein n=1 Tax=Heterodera trifolii TaxID=157864 RepID=A0ABD2JZ96_9BILA